MRSVKDFACTVVAGAALVGSVLPLPAAAADSEQGSTTDGVNALSTFPEFASLPDSAEIDAPLVLHGTVEQITGSVMPGAHVLLWAWPTNDEVRALPEDGELKLTPMARTVADASGGYSLRAVVTDVLRALAGPDGIDIQLDVFHGDRHYTYLSQATPTPSGEWIRNLTGLTDAVDAAVEPVRNLLDLTLDRTKAAVEDGIGLTGSAPVSDHFYKPAPPGCTPFQKVGTRRSLATVATAVARNGAVSQVTYTQDATTETATGGSLGGVFSINGSRSRSFGFNAQFDPLKSSKRRTVNVEYRVEMEHAVLRRSCARDFRGNEDVLHVTSPMGSATGGADVIPSRYPTWSCSPSDPRAAPAKGIERVEASTTRAALYGAAFNFEPLPGRGFSGSASSGYTKSVVVAFTFKGTDPNKRYWCGNTGKPLTGGQRVQGFVQ